MSPDELERGCERVRPALAAPNICLAIDADIRHRPGAERPPTDVSDVGLPRPLGGDERREVTTTWPRSRAEDQAEAWPARGRAMIDQERLELRERAIRG